MSFKAGVGGDVLITIKTQNTITSSSWLPSSKKISSASWDRCGSSSSCFYLWTSTTPWLNGPAADRDWFRSEGRMGSQFCSSYSLYFSGIDLLAPCNRAWTITMTTSFPQIWSFYWRMQFFSTFNINYRSTKVRWRQLDSMGAAVSTYWDHSSSSCFATS